VPASRSFTTDTAVISVVRNVSTNPNVPATMNAVPSSVGLKRARVTVRTPRAGAVPGGGNERGAAAVRARPVAVTSVEKNASAFPATTVSPPS
jgi:hypothetical protein